MIFVTLQMHICNVVIISLKTSPDQCESNSKIIVARKGDSDYSSTPVDYFLKLLVT